MDEWPKTQDTNCLSLFTPYLKYSEPGGGYLVLTPPGPGVTRDVDSVQLGPRVRHHVISHVAKLVTSRWLEIKTLIALTLLLSFTL